MIVAALGAACGSSGASVAPTETPVRSGRSGAVVGASAADFSAVDIDGRPVRLSAHLGKQAVILTFCATWCEPCVAEFWHLRKMVEANRAKLAVIAVAVDGPDTVGVVPSFARRNQINFPMVIDQDSRIAASYNPKRTAPLSILIDKQGRIAVIREGFGPGDEEDLARELAKVLDAPSGTRATD